MLASKIYQGRIDLDFRAGVRSGVNGTPTFFINEIRHDGPFDFDTLLRAIAKAHQGFSEHLPEPISERGLRAVNKILIASSERRWFKTFF
jgi:Thioredoxin